MSRRPAVEALAPAPAGPGSSAATPVPARALLTLPGAGRSGGFERNTPTRVGFYDSFIRATVNTRGPFMALPIRFPTSTFRSPHGHRLHCARHSRARGLRSLRRIPEARLTMVVGLIYAAAAAAIAVYMVAALLRPDKF